MELDDLVITPSEEAEICLNCEKKRCYPGNCDRFKQKMDEIKERRKTHECRTMVGSNRKTGQAD